MVKRRKTLIKKEKNENYIRNNGNEIYWILGVMVIILAALLVAPIIAKSMKTFEYQGLKFTKEKFGEIPVFHYYYNFNDDSGQKYQYNLYLRNEPRLNHISITGDIIYSKGKFVFISMNETGLVTCPTVLRDVHALSDFITGNLLEAQFGTPDKEKADENKLNYVTCDTNPGNTVILLQSGNETKIERTTNECHVITVEKCEDLLPAIEKFIVQSILDAKARAQ